MKKVAREAVTVAVSDGEGALGRHWWSSGAETSTRFVGALDDLRVYERSLTDQQIKRLHALGASKR